MSEPIRDWRGTEIRPDQIVVYGSPVGRSILSRPPHPSGSAPA